MLFIIALCYCDFFTLSHKTSELGHLSKDTPEISIRCNVAKSINHAAGLSRAKRVMTLDACE